MSHFNQCAWALVDQNVAYSLEHGGPLIVVSEAPSLRKNVTNRARPECFYFVVKFGNNRTVIPSLKPSIYEARAIVFAHIFHLSDIDDFL
ncbi:MAG: hypothetical protein FD139_745 [Methylocystaceae bacterium]|nr:MAG: hypothetical protein FD148_62 [Methylocystaceae bacterium]KAF0213995.1 MAG: hypothetical protein FD172_119 [Methylocystaceae bacterium]TXT46900.1 MAG: hypothetical protein FD139_745 [Methylocystaceae bacterium]